MKAMEREEREERRQESKEKSPLAGARPFLALPVQDILQRSRLVQECQECGVDPFADHRERRER
jgi:hypothetical protein